MAQVVFFHEETDHTGFLFKSSTLESVELNRTGVEIWKLCLKGYTPDEVVSRLGEKMSLPPGAEREIKAFIEQLVSENYLS